VKLLLQRFQCDSTATIGKLYIDGVFECYTLELPVRDGAHGSAILPGIYDVVPTYSPHFNRQMPLLIGVPFRSGIEIHYGGLPRNTLGCILVGETHGGADDFIGHTVDEFESRLWPKLRTAWGTGDKVTIELQQNCDDARPDAT